MKPLARPSLAAVVVLAALCLLASRSRACGPAPVEAWTANNQLCVGESTTIYFVSAACGTLTSCHLDFSANTPGVYLVSTNLPDCDNSYAYLTIYVNVPTDLIPASALMCPGCSMIFTAPDSSGSLTYGPSWTVSPTNAGTLAPTNGQAVTFTLSPAYRGSSVTLSAACGTAAITVTNESFSITTQPRSVMTCPGSNVTLTVGATGNSLRYQWRWNGIILSNNPHFTGCTSRNLVINNIFGSTETCLSIPTEKSNGADLDNLWCGDTYSYWMEGCTTFNPGYTNLTSDPGGTVYVDNCISNFGPPQIATSNFTAPGLLAWSLIGNYWTGTNSYFQLGTNGVFQFVGPYSSGYVDVRLKLNYEWMIHMNQGSWTGCVTHTVEGVYDCIVSSDCGSLISSGATLFVSTPCDGISDLWRLEYFGTTTINNRTCATCDPDGDGYSNLQEYRFGTDPTNSVSHPATTNVPPNLVAWWKFDDGSGTIATDSSGNGYNASGGGTWINGVVGGAIDLGSEYGDSFAAPETTCSVIFNQLAVTAWVKCYEYTGGGDSQPYVAWSRGEGDCGFTLEMGTDAPSNVVFTVAGASSSAATIPTNVWVHLAGVYDGSNIYLYTNGVLVGTPVAHSGSVNHCQQEILGLGYDDEWESYLNGALDDVRIYNRALSSDEVAALYCAAATEETPCSISGPAFVCAQSTSNSYSAAPGMASYDWSISGNGSIVGSTAGSTVSVTAGAADWFTLSLSATTSNGCGAHCATMVIIDPQPPPATITTPSTVNAGSAGNIASVSSSLTFETVYNFTNTPDAAPTEGPLEQGSDANFYGVNGGEGYANGAVYRVSPAGVETVLYSFANPVLPEGEFAPLALKQGSDGNFYGTTTDGGKPDVGTNMVFQITPQGTLTTVHTFNEDCHPWPVGKFTLGTDGTFYGVAMCGGTYGYGMVYAITTAREYNCVYSFAGGSDGIQPMAAPVQGPDGNFYGTTQYGGTNTDRNASYAGCGTVYRLTPGVSETVLYRFTGGVDGDEPTAPLVLGRDGNLYGTTQSGGLTDYNPETGLYGYGTVFQITTNGHLITLYAFHGADGSTPMGPLVQGADGEFYGTTKSGGTNDWGTVFRINSAGTLTTLHQFDGDDGAGPRGGLVLGSDGAFYGTTSVNDQTEAGTLFRIGPSSDVWSIIGGTITSSANTPTITWSAGTSSPVTLCVTQTTVGGCSAVACSNITVVSSTGSWVTVTLVQPASNITIQTDTPFTISATASVMNASVTSIFLLTNGSVLASQSSSPFNYNWTTPINACTVTVCAIATDNQGDTSPQSCGTVTVTNTITPCNPISVTLSPSSTNVCVGSTVTFTAQPTGSGPFTYTWYQNNQVLANEATNTLVLDNIQPQDAGTIAVTVMGSCANASASATLTVASTPIVNDQTLATTRDVPVPIVLSGNDPSTKSLGYVIVSGPNFGTITGGSGSNRMYYPNQLFVGTDSFTYEATNATCPSAPATVTIRVVDDYWVVFNQRDANEPSIDDNGDGAWFNGPGVFLLITSVSGATGTVSYVYNDNNGATTNQYFSVGPGAVTQVPVFLGLAGNYANTNLLEPKGIHVVANSPISVYGLYDYFGASGAFTPYATTLLGTNYCVDIPPFYDQSCAVMAVEDNTTVIVGFSDTAWCFLVDYWAIAEGGTYSYDSRFITNTLNQGESFLIEYPFKYPCDNPDSSIGDLSGTFIRSDKPIAVNAGLQAGGFGLCDSGDPTYMQQQVPIESWGVLVPAVPMVDPSGKPTMYRVMAANNNTHVSTNGIPLATLAAGSYADLSNQAPLLFQADQPIQVMKYSVPADTDGIGVSSSSADGRYGGTGSASTMEMPVDRYLTSYTIAIPSVVTTNFFSADIAKYGLSALWPLGLNTFAPNFINIVAEQYGPLPFIDGKQVPANRFAPIGNSGFWGAQIPVTAGAHTITSSRPIGVQVYGYGYDYDDKCAFYGGPSTPYHTGNGYAYNGGMGKSSSATLFAVADATNAALNTAVTINVLANDLYSNITSVGVSLVSGSGPSHGSVSVNADKTITYTPTNGFSGTDQFMYQIQENGNTSTAPVTIWVNNHAPVANDVAATVCTGPTVINVLSPGNDSDPDGDALNVIAVGNPSRGTAVVNADSTVTYNTGTTSGSDSFTYTISDERGGVASATVYVELAGVVTNAGTETLCGLKPKTINVFNHVTAPSGATLTLDSFTKGAYGTVTNTGAGNVVYAPGPGFLGSDQFNYTVDDGTCTATGTILVQLDMNGCGTNLMLTGDSSCQAQVPNLLGTCGFYTQQTPAPNTFASGTTNLILTAPDGSTCTGRIVVVCPSGDPVAIINSPTITTDKAGVDEMQTITNGLLPVTGSAYLEEGATFSNAQYQLTVYKWTDGSLVSDSGWLSGNIQNGLLGTNDLTAVPNGIYSLKLIVQDGNGDQTTEDDVTFILNTNLKVGQFSFSQQDMAFPVGGMPFTLTRTYNSFNMASASDFGYGWTYTIDSAQPQINETRVVRSSYEGVNFSMRTGGGYDVTVTLPNGQQETFAFYLDGGNNAKWRAPVDSYDQLTLSDPASGKLDVNLLGTYWDGTDPATPLTSYDFPGFVLTTRDKTQYIFTRQDFQWLHLGSDTGPEVHAWGPLYLGSIVDPKGNTITIMHPPMDSPDQSLNPVGTITYSGPANNTERSLIFHHGNPDHFNYITSIDDPNTVGTGVPAAIYLYDGVGRLTTASNLVDGTVSPPVYRGTSYIYLDRNDDVAHDYITQIVDSSGNRPIENLYDDSGRLIAIVDAFGHTNSFNHNTAAQTETVTDRLGNQTVNFYDTRGNITETIDPLGHVTARTYDGNNNLLSESNAVGATYYAYDGNGNQTNVIDALGHTTSFTYDGNGNMLTQTDALNRVTINTYDSNNNLWTTTDPLGNVTSNWYDNAGNRTDEYQMNNSGTILTHTHYTYDPSGDLRTVTDPLGHVTTYLYDANGNQTTQQVIRTLLNGGTVTLTTQNIYDGQNRLMATIDPLGYTNQTIYSPNGKVGQAIDKLGRITSYTYDPMGQLIEVDYPDLTSETYGYDPDGHRTSTIDRAGRTTRITYDADGQQILTIYPDGATVSNTYDAVGRLVATTDARTNTTAYVYDAAGRRVVVTNAFGTSAQQVTLSFYDAVGNLVTNIDAKNNVTAYFYDSLNRQTTNLLADGTTQITVYDTLGRRVMSIDQASITNQFGYDLLGRLTSVTNALNKVTSYFYDDLGNLTNQVDARLNATGFGYDEVGRRIWRKLPMGMIETNSYDAVGNLVANIDFNGRTNTFQYDSMNRLVQKTPDIYFDQQPITFTYTLTGQRSNMVDNLGTTTYTYDSRDRLLTETTPVGTLAYAYDYNGNVTSIQSSTANGTAVNYQYDKLNRLMNVIDARLNGSQTTKYGYDTNGNLQSYVYPNGVTNLYAYDKLNRLTNLVWKLNGNTLANFGYWVGKAGNRTNCAEMVNGTVRTNSWAYDSLYRLTTETISGMGSLSYVYDPVGNRTSRSSHVSGIPTTTYSYDANDRLQTDTYDQNGNTTASGGNSYRYNFENRLVEFGDRGAVITYDGDGNRVSEEVGETTTFYLVDSRNPSGYPQVLEELQSVSQGPTNLYRAYTYGLGLINQRQPGVSTNFFVYDGRGSTRLLTDNTTNIVNVFAYDAYGTLIASNGPPQTAHLYCAEPLDSNFGLYYNRARYLNTGTGRFWTRDTYEGDQEDPRSLHKYLYAQDDPVNRIDPFGLDSYLVLYGQAGGGAEFDAAAETEANRLKVHLKPGDAVVLQKTTTFDAVDAALSDNKNIRSVYIFTHAAPNFLCLGYDIQDKTSNISENGGYVKWTYWDSFWNWPWNWWTSQQVPTSSWKELDRSNCMSGGDLVIRGCNSGYIARGMGIYLFNKPGRGTYGFGYVVKRGGSTYVLTQTEIVAFDESEGLCIPY